MQASKLSLQAQFQHQRCCRLPDVGVRLSLNKRRLTMTNISSHVTNVTFSRVNHISILGVWNNEVHWYKKMISSLIFIEIVQRYMISWLTSLIKKNVSYKGRNVIKSCLWFNHILFILIAKYASILVMTTINVTIYTNYPAYWFWAGF